MHTKPLLFALALAAALSVSPGASALAASDPRIAINAANTPGNGQTVFRIAQPGSYYLEANLTGLIGRHGILIASNDVHIDLMGFTLRGDFGGESAIVAEGALSNLSISNGSIYFWSGVGIALDEALGPVLRDIQIRTTAQGGIRVGPGAIVERCRVAFSAGFGIRTGDRALVADCQVEVVSAGVGIRTELASIVRNCIVAQVGFEGLRVGAGSSVLGCRIREAGTKGISGEQATVQDSSVGACAGAGIVLTRGTVRGCEVRGNQGAGIEILLGSGLVVGNQVAANGLDGIWIQGGARVEENDVRDHANGIGIHVVGVRSFVARNSLFSNASPMSVPVAGNFVGPLVSVNAVNGRSDPWANFHSN